MRRPWWLALCLLMAAGPALAFGTISGMGQNREHERITRHALGCGMGGAPVTCFQAASLDEIAGKGGTWGAVGAPDNPARGLILTATAHCDDGDYLDVPGYPQAKVAANANLVACRAQMSAHMDGAVADAAGLLKPDGSIDDSQIPTWVSCAYLGSKGRAKCNVLEDFGLLLHAAQDFYAHSNWTDAGGGTTLDNPPALNMNGRSPWLNLKVADPPFPEGLITGCFDKTSIVSPAAGCPGHVKHEALNKDKGQIDPTLGPGTTPRAVGNANFQRAVLGAIDETRAQWTDLQDRLTARYGPARGSRMICAITHDNPARTC